MKLYTSIGHGMETKIEIFKISEILANLVVKHPP